MKITEVVAVPVAVPLVRPYHIARGIMHQFESVIVKIETDEGLAGFGESVSLSVIGDVGPVVRHVNTSVREALIGRDPFDIEALVEEVLEAGGRDLEVLGGVDCALWDLMGKKLGQPVYRLMGGACNDPILVDHTLGAQEPERMADTAQAMVGEGFSGVVVKVTGDDLQKDIDRVAAVRKRLGDKINIRIDCNTGFSLEKALGFLKGVQPFDIEFVEQPVAADDLAGLRKCREVGVPISVDESLNSVAEALALIAENACDYFNIKIPKVGGLTLGKKIAAIASAADMPVVVGGRTTLELSRYASRHFAASTPSTRGHAHEGPGPASQALSDDIVSVRTTRDTVRTFGSRVPVEKTPGMGADVVWSKVEKYRTEL